MTLKKLLQLLNDLQFYDPGIKLHGSHIYANGGGELTLCFNTQPREKLDAYLRRKGFIVWEGEYIYRPRRFSS